MSNPISSRLRMEYTPRRGFHFPDTSMRGRQIDPSFGDGISYVMPHAETITLSIPVGAVAANSSTTVSGSQQLDLSSLNMAGTDIGRVLFASVSATGPTNLILSHPQINLTSTQGTISGGELSAGQGYSNLSISATVPCYSIAGSSAGTVTISAVMILLGTRSL